MTAIAGRPVLLEAIDATIAEVVDTPDPTLADICREVLMAGGKRVRPRLVILSYMAAGFRDPTPILPLSAALELVHTATLVHDDITDGAALRRGKPTVHERYGIHNALLAADFMFARAFKLIGPYGAEVIGAATDACAKMAEGVAAEYNQRGKIIVGRDVYLRIISEKTAELIGAAAQVGYLAAGNGKGALPALRDFGYNLGMSFQCIDDLLDVIGDPAITGKPRGGDLREGAPNLLTVLALEAEDPAGPLHRLVTGPLEGEELERARALVSQEWVQEEARRMALDYHDRALAAIAAIDDERVRLELVAIAHEVFDRKA